jgi:hypothetical protein
MQKTNLQFCHIFSEPYFPSSKQYCVRNDFSVNIPSLTWNEKLGMCLLRAVFLPIFAIGTTRHQLPVLLWWVSVTIVSVYITVSIREDRSSAFLQNVSIHLLPLCISICTILDQTGTRKVLNWMTAKYKTIWTKNSQLLANDTSRTI